ncbi:MAG: methyltransferase domain-containing protein [candidate division WOR-3 bacterium]|nr:MAG: methyltransferase domain-containing protein [candidate division WOR-3 bacterium]
MKRKKLTDAEVARYWNKNAASWTEQVRKGWDAYREYFNNPFFLKFIGNLKGKRVLDAGCGEGHNTRILAKRGAKVLGIDISKNMIKAARDEERRDPLGIQYRVASFSEMSFISANSIDAIVSFMALMDGPDYQGAIKEFYRILKKNGDLYYSITHPCFLTKGMGWITDERGECIAYKISDYFDAEPIVDHWKFSQGPAPESVEPFAIPSYYRTLTTYLNVLIDNGFTIRRISEPRPTEEMCRKHEWLRRWRQHSAIFLYVHAAKLHQTRGQA